MKLPGATVECDGESACSSSGHDRPPMTREAGSTAGIVRLRAVVPALKALSFSSSEAPATAASEGIERAVFSDCARTTTAVNGRLSARWNAFVRTRTGAAVFRRVICSHVPPNAHGDPKGPLTPE